jgi:protocatechuate 3,4-dioxygenase beta subunit
LTDVRLEQVLDRGGDDPPYLHEEYVATRLRAPRRPLVLLPHTFSELTGPVYGDDEVTASDHDLTSRYDAPPQGQRIVVSGRVLEEDGRPVRDSLVEIWQANAAGRYRHDSDRHDAPLDPNFDGGGRCLTDSEGRYRFVTVKPGCYPWPNHPNAWRPAHIHFSLFGRAFVQRLVTQMYFPDDPLFPYDPIFGSIREPKARGRLICGFDLESTIPDEALGFTFDIVLRGAEATPLDDDR